MTPLIHDPRSRKLSFTGSTAVGQETAGAVRADRDAHLDGTGRQRALHRLRRCGPGRGGRGRAGGEDAQYRAGLHRGQPVLRAARRGRRIRRTAGRADGRIADGTRHRTRRRRRPADRRRRGGQGDRTRRRRRRARRHACCPAATALDGPGHFYPADRADGCARRGADLPHRESSARSRRIATFDTEDEAVERANDTALRPGQLCVHREVCGAVCGSAKLWTPAWSA